MSSRIRRRLAVFVAALLALGALTALAGAAPVVFSTTPFAGWSTNGTVRAVVIVGDTAYAGGDFTQVRGPGGSPTVARSRLAAWDVRTGALRTGFSSDANGRVESLASDGTKLFVGGDFTTIKGATKNRLAAVDLISGNVITTWTANATSHVYALTVKGDRLYVGGAFGTLAGATRSKIGAVAVATGAIDPGFDPDADDAVHGIAISPDGATVYVGGDFTTVGTLARPYLAAVTATTGTPTSTTFPYPTGGTVHGMYGVDISPAGDQIFGATTENRALAWSTTTGQQQWSYEVNGDVQAVRYHNGNVYFGFHEGAIGDSTVRLLVADAATGALEDYRPPIDSFYGIRAIDATNAGLVVGGEFLNVNGVATQGIAILPPQTVDTVLPGPPGTPVVTGTTATSASLTWTPGTDNVGVGGYRVLRDGVPVAYLTTPSFTDTGLASDTDVVYSVQTIDTGGNLSPASGTVTAHTGLGLVAAGATWRFLDDGSDQGSAWRATTYDDSTWKSGPAELGYGDGDEATVVGYGPDPANRYLTTYFRRNFTVANPAAITSLTLGLVRDDGAVVYLNGAEVARSDLPAGTITSTTRAVTAVGGAEESQWFGFPVSPSLLQSGTNTLAVEIHQNNATSSDISFNASLDATATNAPPPPPPPAPPTGLTVTGVTETTVGLAWTAPTGGGTTTGYRVYRDGALVASPSTTTATDTDLAAGHTYAYTVSAITDGTETATTGPVSATTVAAATTVLTPVGDSYVTSAKATKNYGAGTELKLATGTAEYRPYLQFAVDGLGSAPQSATLRLYVTNGSDGGGAWRRVTPPWSEADITWANAPAPTDPAFATVGRVDSGTWIDIDVTGQVTGNGVVSFAATTASTNTARFASRESAFPPQLVLETNGQPSAPTASFTSSATSGPAPLTVDFVDTSTGGVTSRIWSFGDGATASVAAPSHTFVGPGSYTVQLTATNGVGSDTASTTITVGSPPAVTTFLADADTYVSASSASKNYGGYADLKLLGPGGKYEYRPFFGFTVTGLAGTPTSAILRVHVSDSGPSGGTWHRVAGAWDENTLTWANAPALTSAALGTLGPVGAGSWIEIDVTSEIAGSGNYSFAAETQALSTVMFSSRESGFAAELVVTR